MSPAPEPPDALSGLLGDSPEMVDLRQRVRRLLDRWSATRRPPPVLVQGETGTGKGLLARLIHDASRRADQPFVEINCAALPETLVEAELFGWERGAFTDARQAKPGLFQQAHRGTLFLDEVGLLSGSAQTKLLRALEEGTIRPLGGVHAEPVDAWVIAATNEDLEAPAFRPDLFHRLAVFTLDLPPLRSRPADILPLAGHFLARACADYGLAPRRFSEDARAALTAFAWPGNVRELGNVIERAALLGDSPVISAAQLALSAARKPSWSAAAPAPVDRPPARSKSDELERTLIETGWNVSRTAEILDITRNTVRARMERAGLRRPSEVAARRASPPRKVSASTPAVPSDVSKLAFWESRRLTFLRVQVVAGTGLEAESRLARQLDDVGRKLVEFGGRIEGLSPRALLAVFGVDPSDEPTVLAGHGALAVRNVARQIRSNGGDLELVVGLHAEEIALREGEGVAVLDADASRRVWTTLQGALEHTTPDAIVATTAAAALLRRRFILTRLTSVPPLYRVERLWHAQAVAKSPRAPMVGRREELALLMSRLASAVDGRGRVVDIVGEAGIGKSRLLAELFASPSSRPVEYLEGRCVSAEIQTPFYPVLQIVRTACGIEESDPPPMIRDKVNQTVVRSGLDPDQAVVELHYLLGATTDPPEAPGSALTKRQYNALQRLFVALSRRHPLVIVVDDLHWVDPTSEAWLATLVDSTPSAAILFVATYRSEYRPPWAGRAEVLSLSLSPLPAAESLALIRSVLGVRWSSEPLERSIQAKAEGNPLFLEELSLAAVERGDGTLPEHVPATVEDTVTGRLARFEGRQRRVLRAAAVIGREFSRRLLHHVCDVPEDDLDAMLRQFQQADFLSMSGAGEARWIFKHALVQQAAYAGLSPRTRRVVHLRVLDMMEKLYAERLTDVVERLAHHAEQGDDRARKTRYLLLAGRKAAGRSALAEATGHLSRGLDVLMGFAPSADRDREELEFQVALGNVLRVSLGGAAPEVERAYGRARELLRRVRGPHAGVALAGPALVGDWSAHLLKARYHAAQVVAEELFAAAEKGGDPLLRVVARRSLGMTALYRGDFRTVRSELEQGFAAYRSEFRARAVAEYGVSPHIGCLAYLGRALWCLGYPDQALARNRQAVAEAEACDAPLGVAIALGMQTSIHQLRGEVRETVEMSNRAIAYANEWGITYWGAQSTVLRAWADAVSASGPDPAGRLDDARRSVEQYRDTGSLLALTWFQILLAETFRASGRPEDGLAALDAALAHANETGERYHEAEIHRLRGELVGDPSDARACFGRALEVARSQQAKAWELRAATSLARLLQREQRDREARAVLRPVYAWFTEGFGTADLAEARALLEALGT